MKIGIPKRIKNNENRVGLSPSDVHTLVDQGHEVLIEANAGLGSYFENGDYQEAGAKIVDEQSEAWDADVVIKVKESFESECKFFEEELTLLAYLHLANEQKLTQALVGNKIISIAYETVQLPDGSLSLLTPVSEVAGRMSTQAGTEFLQRLNGGMGILLGGIPGVPKGKVTIIGGGQVGTNAAKIASGLRAEVTILDANPECLGGLEDLLDDRVRTIMSSPLNIEMYVKGSDLVIGTVLIPGTKTPNLVTEDMIKGMKDGPMIVDIAMDQDGISETADKITAHDNPTYTRHGVVHYAITNMPGAVPHTSTIGLNNVILPYAQLLTNKGYHEALKVNHPLSLGLNTFNEHVTNRNVADTFNFEYASIEDALK